MQKILLMVCFLLGTVLPVSAAETVFVSIAPQKYFVEHIGGDHVQVRVLVPPGSNPHAYEPRPRQMAALAQAKIFFSIGDSFDHAWLPRIVSAHPQLLVVDTSAQIQKIPMTDHSHCDCGHEHHHDAEHHHGGLDPHIWLDPALVRIQAAAIRDGLIRIDPQNAAEYRKNYEQFSQELHELDKTLREILSPLPQTRRAFMVFHPSWGYFAKAYGLHQIAIEADGREPSPKDMHDLIEKARSLRTKAIFVQPQFSQKSAQVIAEQLGAKVARLDPLAEDWAENLRQAAHVLTQNLR